MDTNRHYRFNQQPADQYSPQPGDRFNSQVPHASPYAADMGKTYAEHVDSIPMESKTPGSIRSGMDDAAPSEAELNLLKKLRTLNGADYEAQYFDNKPNPNKQSMISKIGNPSAL